MRRALRKAVFLVLPVTGWAISTGCALAEKRIALIIGNSNYEKVARFPIPLTMLHFHCRDLQVGGLRQGRPSSRLEGGRKCDGRCGEFVENSREADVAVVYFVVMELRSMAVTIWCRSMRYWSETLTSTMKHSPSSGSSGRRRARQAAEARDPRCLPG